MEADFNPPAIVWSIEQEQSKNPVSRELLGQFGLAKDQALLTRMTLIEERGMSEVTNYLKQLNNDPAAPATFVADQTLRLSVTKDCSILDLAVLACGVKDAQSLTKAHVSSLRAVNSTSDAAVINALDNLVNQFDRSGSELNQQVVKAGVELKLISPEALRYEIKKNEILADILKVLPGERLSDSGRNNLNDLLKFTERIDIHLQVQAISLEQEIENNQTRSGNLSSQQTISAQAILQLDSLAALRNLCERAEKSTFPDEQLKKIKDIYKETEVSTIVAYIAGRQRLSEVAESNDDWQLALKHLAVALKLSSERPAEVQAQQDPSLIRESARAIASAAMARDLINGTPQQNLSEVLAPFFTEREGQFMIAQSYLRWSEINRTKQYTEPAQYNAQIDERAFAGARRHFERVVTFAESALSDLAAPEANAAHERFIVRQSLDVLLEHALRQDQIKEVKRLYNLSKALTSIATPEEQEIESLGLNARMLRAVFEHPQRFKKERSDINVLSEFTVADLTLREARVILAQKAESTVSELSSILKRHIDSGDSNEIIKKTDYELGQAHVALSRIFVSGSVSPTDPQEREHYYEKLSSLNQQIATQEKAILKGLKEQRDILREEKLDRADPSSKPRIEILDQEILARSLSLAQLTVFQAEVALAGNTPKLLRHAQKIVAELETEASEHTAIAKLVSNFRSANQSEPAIAALKEFLAEVNKDYPPYTLAAMIALGMLGAAAGSWYGRRGALEGFMAISCATLGVVKGYYAIAGLPEVAAAWDTGLSSFNLQQTGLNVAYWTADLMQTAPVAAALIALAALKRQKPIEQIESQQRLSSASHLVLNAVTGVGHESWEALKSAGSLLVPTSFNSAVLYLTIAVAGTQLAQSNLPAVDIQEQLAKIATELGMTVTVAVMQARIVHALWSANQKRNSGILAPAVAHQVENILENPTHPSA